MKSILLAGLGLAGALLALSRETVAADKFELRDGDRVVLLGGTFIEREQSYGYLEAALISYFPGRKITVRNLGWSGDTVWGDARAGFEGPTEGFQRLLEQTRSVKPTVILIAYGANESFAGPAGLENFVTGLNRLLDGLAKTEARLILLSPLKQENHGPPRPDPAAQNENIRLYAEAIQKVAAARDLIYADLFSIVAAGELIPDLRLTDNGIHLTAAGYWRTTPRILVALGLTEPSWLVEVDRLGQVKKSQGAKVKSVERTPTGLKLRVLDEQITSAAAPPGTPEMPILRREGRRALRVRGLAGEVSLRIDGEDQGSYSAEEWDNGIVGLTGPDFDQAERLRRQIVAKNELYFLRWRPQNETYLFGFRKAEQGKNAVEIPQFDPLIASKETRIQELLIPVEHEYELIGK